MNMQIPQRPRSDIAGLLLDAAGLSVDRLPMLQGVFERAAESCGKELGHMIAAPVFLAVEDIASARFGAVLDTYGDTAVTALFTVPEWGEQIIIGLDRAFVLTIIEIMFGGDGSEPLPSRKRPFSPVELRASQAAAEAAAQALQAAFAPIARISLEFDRIEDRLQAVLGPRLSAPVIAATSKLTALGRNGVMFVIIPQSALAPLRQALGKTQRDETAPRDSNWSRRIESEVKRADVRVKAVLEERHLTLGDMAGLRVGQILQLQSTPASHVKLESNGQPLFWCELGQGDGIYTVRVHGAVDQEQEFIDDILPR